MIGPLHVFLRCATHLKVAILACLAKKCVENAKLGTFQKITCLRVVAQVFQFIENGKGIFK